MQFGVLLPHFGKEASPSRIIDGSKMCEELGFHSVWVRDHLIWHPHGMEKSGLKFVEPIVTLSAVAAVTKKIILGIAVLVPVRWPLKVSQDLASLSYIAGGRVIAGMGLGFNPAELATVGLRIEDRIEILRETVEIARLIWKENNASFKGKIFSFENVTIEPKPVEPIPIFCGGSTRAAIRRAAEYCDGWIPGRVPMATFDDRTNYLRQLTDRKITLGNIPITRIDKDRKKARASIDVAALAGRVVEVVEEGDAELVRAGLVDGHVDRHDLGGGRHRAHITALLFLVEDAGEEAGNFEIDGHFHRARVLVGTGCPLLIIPHVG